MSVEEIFQTLGEMVGEQLGMEPESVSMDSSFEDLGADSVDMVELVMAVEEEFEIGETPEEALDLQTLGERISAFLQAQPAEKRNLFLRRYWYCDSILDIARRYGLSESKVKSSLSRSRKALREQLRKEGYDV